MRLPVLAILALSFAALVAACSSAGGSTVTVVPGSPTEAPSPDGQDPTATPGNDATATATAPDPTATPTEDANGDIILPCGDPLVPVDKVRALPSDCVPANLLTLPSGYSWGGEQQMVEEAAGALREMLDAARDDGFEMFAASSYRSYEKQASTFQYWVDTIGLAEAERSSARPGHSEHQLGTTTDLTIAANGGDLDAFRGTPEADWVANNSWRFGFVVSYPPDGEPITGYLWEPWHVRYIGVDLAREQHESGLTLGQFLQQR